MSKERAKGTSWESAVRDYLNDQGIPVHRAPLSSPTGDLDGLDPAVIECKDQREQRLAIWVDQASESAEKKSLKTGKPVIPIVVAKRKMKSTAHGYAIMPLWALAALLSGELSHWFSNAGRVGATSTPRSGGPASD